MKKIILLISLSFCLQNIFAQTTISGTVQDKSEALIGVNVYLEGTYSGTTTDIDGHFSFKAGEKGIQTLKVEYLGYEPFIQQIDLKGEALSFEVTLKEAFNKLNAVTITAGAFEAGDKKKTVVLNSIDMVTTAGALGDVTGALQTLPGTTTVGESGKLFVRGGHSDESKTFIDGTRVFKPYGSQVPNLSVRGRFNPFMFQGTVFSTGGYSAEYGQALSSVLLLETKGIQAKDQLDFSIMTIGVDAAGTKRWEKSALTATIAYSDLTPYMSTFKQKDEWVSAPKTIAGAISFRQETANNGLFKFYSSYDNSFLHVRQKSVNDTLKSDDFALTNDNSFTNANWKGLLSGDWSMQVGVSYTYDKDKISANGDRVFRTLKGNHVKAKFTNYFSDMLSFKFGVDYLNNSFEQEFISLEGTFLNKFKDNMYGVYAESDIYASSNLVFRAGLRGEYSDLLQTFNLAPRFSTAYKFNKTTQLSLAYGIFYQNPKDQYLIYTDELQQERADHYMLNFQYDKNRRSVRAEIYYKDYKRLVKTIDDIFFLPEGYNNKGNGYAYGFDFYFRDKKTIKNGDYWVSYSYLQSERDYKNFPSLAIPNFVSTHNLSLVYKHWFSKIKSFASATYQYSSPRMYTDPNTGGFNDQKLKPYQNLSLSWTYLYRQNIIFYTSVKNVLGFKNEFGYNFSEQPNSEGIYTGQKIEPGSKRFFFLGCFITFSKDDQLNQLDKIDL